MFVPRGRMRGKIPSGNWKNCPKKNISVFVGMDIKIGEIKKAIGRLQKSRLKPQADKQLGALIYEKINDLRFRSLPNLVIYDIWQLLFVSCRVVYLFL